MKDFLKKIIFMPDGSWYFCNSTPQKKKMATPKQPKYGEKYSHVMADLDIKFEPNRSRQNSAWFGLFTKFSA
jgi:hypothetical protein